MLGPLWIGTPVRVLRACDAGPHLRYEGSHLGPSTMMTHRSGVDESTNFADEKFLDGAKKKTNTISDQKGHANQKYQRYGRMEPKGKTLGF